MSGRSRGRGRQSGYVVRDWAHVRTAPLRAPATSRFGSSREALAGWRATAGRRTFSDAAIIAALTVRAVYRLALRHAEGLISFIFALLDLALPVPDHTTLSRRGRRLHLGRQADGGQGLDLAIDSTGLRLARMHTFQCLDRWLFVDTKNNRLGRHIIQVDHVDGFRHEGGGVALAPGFAGGKVDLVLTQKPPDILNVNVAQRLRHQRARPPRMARPRWPIQNRQNALIRRRTVERLPASTRPVLQPCQALLGKAPPPVADDARMNAHLFSDRPRAAAPSRRQHCPRPHRLALPRLGARHSASRSLRTFGVSQTSLASEIIPT